MTLYQIAIPLPSAIKKTLHRICCGLPSVEWMEEENLHITLFHLGKIDGAMLLDIQECLSKIEFTRFDLSVKDIDHSHTKGNRGAIRAGVSISEPLSQLKKAILKCLKESGVKFEIHSLEPHVTLAHFSRLNPLRLAEYLSSYSIFFCPPFIVDGFVLMSVRETAKRTIYSFESFVKASSQ